MFQKANDLLASIIENIHIRAKSPIVSSFFISWLIVNWKLVLVFLLVDGNILVRIHIIKEYNEFGNYWYLIVMPLLMSSIYLLIIPVVNIFIQGFLKKINEKEIELTFSQKKLFLEKNSEYENKKRELQENSNFNLNIDNLKQDITNKDLEIGRLHGEISNKNNEIERLLIEKKDYERKQQQILEELHTESQKSQKYYQEGMNRLMHERQIAEKDFQDRMMRMERNFSDEKEQLKREYSNQIYGLTEQLKNTENEFNNILQRERNHHAQEIDRLSKEVEKSQQKRLFN